MKLNKGFLSIAVISAIFWMSCGWNKVEGDRAFACAEGFMAAVKSNNKEEAVKFYSTSFDEGPAENRLEKLQKLADVTGPVLSYTLQDSAHVNAGDLEAMSFTYKVTHSKVATIEKIIVIRDGGDYKITTHDIQSENLK
jgi:hypothetical protein